MIKRLVRLDWLERFREYAPLFIRLIIGWHLLYGVQDNVRSWHQMLEFRDFLIKYHFPVPLFSAVLSVYAQLICGALYVIGLWVRPAAAVMIINFAVALYMVHWGRPYPGNALAFLMFFGSWSLLFSGAGRISLDALLRRRK